MLGIRKRLQLHLRHLPRIYKADVLIGNGDFSRYRFAFRHHNHQGLGTGDHTANRVNGQLLNDTGQPG